MITVRISEDTPCERVLEKIEDAMDAGARSFEISVRALNEEHLVLCSEVDNCLSVDRLFEILEKKKIELVLNLVEPNLESLVQSLVMKWEVRKHVKYTGQVNPTYLTPWDRLNVYYNVENCLPNFYQFDHIKRSHFDVIHYFCRTYKVKTLRIAAHALTEEIIYWAHENDLMLSVFDVETVEKAKELKAIGIEQITLNEFPLYAKQ